MKNLNKKTILTLTGGLLFLLIAVIGIPQITSMLKDPPEEISTGYLQDIAKQQCTIGVAAGKATPDGRPMIWKTLDDGGSSKYGIHYDSSLKYSYIGYVYEGDITDAWFGVNEAGFAIANSLALDMTIANTGMPNGQLMKFALGNCENVEEFEKLLDSTNVSGRKTQANFVVMDATGEAKLFEVDGLNYWVYDANNETVAPDGYIIRTNFTNAGGGSNGIQRYLRSKQIMSEFSSGDSLSYKSILRYQMRDFASEFGVKRNMPFDFKLYPESPHGYYNPIYSICNMISKSSVVIQGILENEDPRLTTMWTIMGQPATSIAIPCWVVGSVPYELKPILQTSRMAELSWLIKEELFDLYYIAEFNYEFDLFDSYKLLDGNGGGLWTMTFPLEDTIISRTNKQLDHWRTNGIDEREMMSFKAIIADYAYTELENIYNQMFGSSSADQLDLSDQSALITSVYPNPSSDITNISITLEKDTEIDLMVYNTSGQLVKTIYQNQQFPTGSHEIQWNGENDQQYKVLQGIYIIVLTTSGERISKTCMRL